ncbi:MAG TPA: hypothetical protein VGQ41_27460 [Pyrinomonadaceae bacterium]|jgi:hypothetical protein|nr:hypothetical protein [Pyrinomonadaceae bacterium]
MKVLLVYPWFPDTYWRFRHALSFEGKRSLIPPLGLITISALLPASWEKRLVDMNVRPLTDADLKWAGIVFASAMHIQKDLLEEVIQRSKARGKRVVVSGPMHRSAAMSWLTLITSSLVRLRRLFPNSCVNSSVAKPNTFTKLSSDRRFRRHLFPIFTFSV